MPRSWNILRPFCRRRSLYFSESCGIGTSPGEVCSARILAEMASLSLRMDSPPTTQNSHGWMFAHDGLFIARLNPSFSTALGTGSGRYARMLFRVLIPSIRSITGCASLGFSLNVVYLIPQRHRLEAEGALHGIEAGDIVLLQQVE